MLDYFSSISIWYYIYPIMLIPFSLYLFGIIYNSRKIEKAMNDYTKSRHIKRLTPPQKNFWKVFHSLKLRDRHSFDVEKIEKLLKNCTIEFDDSKYIIENRRSFNIKNFNNPLKEDFNFAKFTISDNGTMINCITSFEKLKLYLITFYSFMIMLLACFLLLPIYEITWDNGLYHGYIIYTIILALFLPIRISTQKRNSKNYIDYIFISSIIYPTKNDDITRENKDNDLKIDVNDPYRKYCA